MNAELVSTPDLMARAVATTAGMSDGDVKKLLLSKIQAVAMGLAEAACLVAVCDQRGIPLGEIEARCPLVPMLRLVAAGRLPASAALTLAGQKTLLAAVAVLPTADQVRILEEGAVPVYTPGADGTTDVRKVPIAEMPAAIVRQVFANGSVRTPEEQRAYLQITKPRRPKVEKPDLPNQIRRAKTLLAEIESATNIKDRSLKAGLLHKVAAEIHGLASA